MKKKKMTCNVMPCEYREEIVGGVGHVTVCATFELSSRYDKIVFIQKKEDLTINKTFTEVFK